MAGNLHTSVDAVRRVFCHDGTLSVVARIIQGLTTKSDGNAYSPVFVERIWRAWYN